MLVLKRTIGCIVSAITILRKKAKAKMKIVNKYIPEESVSHEIDKFFC